MMLEIVKIDIQQQLVQMHMTRASICRFRHCHPGDLLPESFQRYGMRTFIEALMLAYDVPKEAPSTVVVLILMSGIWETHG